MENLVSSHSTEAVKKPYNHVKYAGNAGDIWKHFLLGAALKQSVAMRSCDGPFVYCETHGGPGISELMYGKEWRRGLAYLWDAGDDPSRRLVVEDLLKKIPAMAGQGFFDAISGSSRDKKIYLGSWVQAYRTLMALGRISRLEIFESSQEAYDIARTVTQDMPQTSIYQNDGFSGLERLLQSRVDFVAIDPPYKTRATPDDWTLVNRALRVCVDHDVDVFVWYPIFKTARHLNLDQGFSDHFWRFDMLLEKANLDPDYSLDGSGVIMSRRLGERVTKQNGEGLETLSALLRGRFLHSQFP